MIINLIFTSIYLQHLRGLIGEMFIVSSLWWGIRFNTKYLVNEIVIYRSIRRDAIFVLGFKLFQMNLGGLFQISGENSTSICNCCVKYLSLELTE